MDLTKTNAAARATMAAKFRLVFSHRRATRLKRLSLPPACSMRVRPRSRAFAKKPGLSFLFTLYGMTGMMPRDRAACRFALLA